MNNKPELLTIEEIRSNLLLRRETFEYKVRGKIVRVTALVYRNSHGAIVLAREIKKIIN